MLNDIVLPEKISNMNINIIIHHNSDNMACRLKVSALQLDTYLIICTL